MPSFPFARRRDRRPDARRTAFLTAAPFAHRGLHGGSVVENSRAAFRAAIGAGHGIELDVQASRDGEAFVFHDATLDRLTDVTGTLATLDAATLDAIRLTGTAETLPRLAEVLALVGGRVPLLIEVKAAAREAASPCEAVARALSGYQGAVGVMSFHPEAVHRLRRAGAGTAQGLIVTERGRPGLRGSIARRIAVWRARPQFLAYDVRDLPSRFASAQRARGLPVLSWTVRTAAERVVAGAHADQIIYEHHR